MVTASAIARLLLYLGALIVMGDAAVRWIDVRVTDERERDASESRLQLRLAWLGVVLALVALAIVEARDMELDATRSAWQMMLTQTAWGRGWSILLVSAILGTAAAVWRVPRAVATACALLLAVAMGGLGHASADDALPVFSRVIDAVHVIGVGAWLGALLLMSRTATVNVWQRYSRMASVAAPTVLLSGVFASLRRLQLPPLGFGASSLGLSTIVASDYGRLLLTKSAVVLVVLAFGLKHRRRVLSEHAPSGQSIRTELVFAVAVLAATALLTGTAPPSD